MIALAAKDLKIIREILSKYPYKFYAFGSRVKGKARKYSDLDLCHYDPIPWNIKAHIDEDFAESELPYIVEIVDLNLCDADFRARIEKDLVELN